MFCFGIITKMLENVYFFVIPLLVSERPEVQNSLCTISFETEKGGLGSQEKKPKCSKEKRDSQVPFVCWSLFLLLNTLCLESRNSTDIKLVQEL
jgi:hypothetical protein